MQTRVRGTTFTEPTDVEIVATRMFDAPREMVWAAHTQPEHVRNWQLGPDGWTMPVCDIDLRPGGSWHFIWKGPQGEDLEMRGEYREIVPPERLVNTEAWGGEWPEAVDTLMLAEEDGKTLLTASVRYATHEVLEAAKATGMEDGWAQSYDRLEEYLRSLGRAS